MRRNDRRGANVITGRVEPCGSPLYTRRTMRTILPALLLGLLLTACGGQSPSAPAATPSPAPSQPATAQPTVPAASPAPAYPVPGDSQGYPAPTTPDAATSDGTQAQIEAEARNRLAAHLGVDAATLSLTSAERQDWPDGSLGCPQPNTTYAQVVIPGFKLEFSDGTRSYPVHTSMATVAGEPMVLCDNGTAVDLALAVTGPDLAEEGRMMIQRAKDDLAARLQIADSEITVVLAQPMEWPDSSLGCPSPSESYMQVITPGYKIDLFANGTLYPYHTDANSRVVLCEQA
jgi:hypothetical protein